MSELKFACIGAAVQDVFLSKSEALDPVREEDGSDYAELKMGGKADVDQINFSTGGGATNAAVTFARQGFGSHFLGSVADDPAGQAVLVELKKEGVDASRVSYSRDFNTGYSVILLAANGERTILTYRGASTHYNVEDFDLSDLGHLDWLYISSVSGKVEVLQKILPQAKQLNIKVAYNPGKSELENSDLKQLLKDYVEILIVNKDEMNKLVDGDDLESLALAGNQLCPVVVVSDGPAGVAATDGKTFVKAGLYEDVPVIDRTGAGDAFGSGFVSQIAQGKTLGEAVKFASANSTSVVSQIGAKAGILRAGVQLHEMTIEEKSL